MTAGSGPVRARPIRGSAGMTAANRKAIAQANLRCITGEPPEGHTVYWLEFSDGSACVGQTGRLLLRRLSSHMLETLSIQSRIAAGQSMRVAFVASGLSRSEAQRLEAVEIARTERGAVAKYL